MEGFMVGVAFVLFVLFVLACFGLIFAGAICFLDVGTHPAPKPVFDPHITEEEQRLLVARFRSFSFDEMPQFMYGLRQIPPRNVRMQFSHRSRCYIDVSKDITKQCFKYEVKYKKTLIKTFYDLGEITDYCWHLHIDYRDNPDLVIKRLKIEKREALAAGDFE